MTEAESGEYVCKVSNYIGEANQSAWLTVTRPLAKGNRKNARRGVSSDRQSPAVENKTLGSLVSAVFLVRQAMEKYSAGPARFCVLCVCVSLDVSPVCFPPRHADTGTAQVPSGSGTTKPRSLQVLPWGQPPPSHPARPPRLHVTGDDTVLHPPSVLPSCLQPPVSVLVPPRVVQVHQPALPEVYFSMWPIASMFRWAGHSVW